MGLQSEICVNWSHRRHTDECDWQESTANLDAECTRLLKKKKGEKNKIPLKKKTRKTQKVNRDIAKKPWIHFQYILSVLPRKIVKYHINILCLYWFIIISCNYDYFIWHNQTNVLTFVQIIRTKDYITWKCNEVETPKHKVLHYFFKSFTAVTPRQTLLPSCYHPRKSPKRDLTALFWTTETGLS